MRPILLSLALALAIGGASRADEVETVIEQALDAYRAGDFSRAREELDYAKTLLDRAKAEGLAQFLPPVFAGWTRRDDQSETLSAVFLGGGLTASSSYAKGGETVAVKLMADNPMVASMGAMLATPSLMSALGDVRRLGRMSYVVTQASEVIALVDNRIFVQVSGTAPEADKIAYFEAIDFDGLRDF
jgi:hypothetical protein